MHGFAVLSLFAMTALVAAQQETYFLPLATYNNQLAARQQNCASVGGRPCGVYCMRLTDTCCGNGAGACHLGTVCGLADNGIYGCCPIGRNCRGNAPNPSVTTKIGGPRPTSTTKTRDDGPTSTSRSSTKTSKSTRTSTTTSTSSRRLTLVSSSTSSNTVLTEGGADSSTSTLPQPTSGSGSGSSGSGSGSGSGSSGSGSGSGSSNGGAKASAGTVRISLATLACGFIAAVASLL